MVTTTSLDQNLNFVAQDLLRSEFKEDHQIAASAGICLTSIVKELIPVLPYVDTIFTMMDGESVRGIAVIKQMGNCTGLVLTRNGEWRNQSQNGKLNNIRPDAHDDSWVWYPFVDIVNGLKETFKLAVEKKKTHLAAIAARRDFLDRLGAAIDGNK